MSAPANSPFLAAMRTANLLDPARLVELTKWAEWCHADTPVIAAEVVRRGWLTPFQAEEVKSSRGDALTFGPYVLIDRIAEDSPGRRYKAHDRRSGQVVALNLHSAPVDDQFRQRMRSAARLAHPNLARVLEVGDVRGTHYIATEFVEGIDLYRLVRTRGPLAVPPACDYVRQAALGLQYAAEQGFVYQDLKPSQLMVTPHGQVKVLNPELATRGDNRTGLQALGAALFYLLTGQAPIEGSNIATIRPDIPPQLDALIQSMMAKRPEDRPQSLDQVVLALSAFSTPSDAAPRQEAIPEFAVPGVERAPIRGGKRTSMWMKLVLVALVGLVGLAAIAGVTYVLFSGKPGVVTEQAEEFTNPVGITMVRLPGGSFRMGSPEGEPARQADEMVAAEVAVSGPFFISTHEVTHGQFQAVMGKSPAHYAPRMRNPAAVPVDSVTREEANEFCRRLTAMDRNRQSGWAYRLPTEAEWEYACRAGTETPFWSGEMLVLGKHAIFDLEKELAAGGTHGEGDQAGERMEKNTPYPVGSTTANPFGLFDTHGNVWEWCADTFEDGQRVVRGGSWREPAARCRSAARRLLGPMARERDVGFRVVFAPVN